MSFTLLTLLESAAQRYPRNGLIFYDHESEKPETTMPYVQLLCQSRVNAARLLSSTDVSSGDVVLVYFEEPRDNIIWTWSIIAAGAIPAILSPLSKNPSTLKAQLEHYENLFRNSVLLTSPLLAQRFNSMQTMRLRSPQNVDMVDFSFELLAMEPSVSPNSTAVLLFTSGSTGHAKAIEYSHEQLIRSVAAKQQLHGLSEKVNFMSWVSFDHSANFCELHLNAMYSGSNQLHLLQADLVNNPARFYHIISSYQVGYTFTPNSFLAAANRAILAAPALSLDFRQLRVIMVAGEANRTATLQAADEILTRFGAPTHSLKAAYGLSETCSACFYNVDTPSYDVQHNNFFATVGKPLPQVLTCRIANDADIIQPFERSGRIQLKGDILFSRYHNNESATMSCITSDGWFDTGDLGRLDANGNLVVEGRSKEVIIVNGCNYSSFELEHAIESSDIHGLTESYTATFSSWRKAGNTEGIVVLFNPVEVIAHDASLLRFCINEINQATFRFCSAFPIEVIPLPRDQMPKSTIGKLSRQKLKEAYERGDFDKYILSADNTNHHSNGSKTPALHGPVQKAIANAFARETGIPYKAVDENTDLMFAGMNSIIYLRLKYSLEKELQLENPLPMTTILQAGTIKKLEHAILTLPSTSEIYEPIVVLQSQGSRVPLFLLPPGGGDFILYLELVKYLIDRPVYALRNRGATFTQDAFDSLREMIDCYELAIRKTQPQGPYAFLGYSFGGLLAFEMGKRFEEAGDRTVFIGGVDNPSNPETIAGGFTSKQYILDRMVFSKICSKEEVLRLAKESAHITDTEPFFEFLFQHYLPEKDLAKVGITIENILAWDRVNLDLRTSVMDSYVPRGCVSKYDEFYAPPHPALNMSEEEWRDVMHGWKQHALDVNFYDVEGLHEEILTSPYLERFQERLNEAMELRGA